MSMSAARSDQGRKQQRPLRQKEPDDASEEPQGLSRMHYMFSPGGKQGSASLGGGNSCLEQQLLLQMNACIQDNPHFSRLIQEEMLQEASGERHASAWQSMMPSVQQLGRALKPTNRSEAEPGPRVTWLERQQQRCQHIRQGADDSYDPEGDESYSDDYASVLKTAIVLWEEEGSRHGRRLGKHAFRGRLALRSMSWPRRLVALGKEGKKLPGIPAAWVDGLDHCMSAVPPPASLQWRLPWAAAPAP